MLKYAEGSPTQSVWNAYREIEAMVTKTVREVLISKVPKSSNIITIHVIYKIKAKDDGSFKMKARIAPHGNKDKDCELLKTDSAQCPPTGKGNLTPSWLFFSTGGSQHYTCLLLKLELR